MEFNFRSAMHRGFSWIVLGASLVMFALSLFFWLSGLYVDDIATWGSGGAGGQKVRTLSVRAGRGGFQIEDYQLTFLQARDGGDGQWWTPTPDGFQFRGNIRQSSLDEWTTGRSEPIPDATKVPYDDVLINPNDWPDIGPGLAESSLLQVPKLHLHNDSTIDSSYVNIWRGVVIPYWLTTVLSLAVLVSWFTARERRRWRERTRLRAGACPRCGYDLRATPDRCPKCGLVGKSLNPSGSTGS